MLSGRGSVAKLNSILLFFLENGRWDSKARVKAKKDQGKDSEEVASCYLPT